MRPYQFTTSSFPAAVADSIATAQTLSTAGDVNLDGTTTLVPPCYITITSVGNDTGVDFTITGTSPAGYTQSEVLGGASGGAATSTLTYSSITSIAADGATAGDIEVGNTQSGYGAWLPMDIYTPNQVTSISATVFGTVDYSVEYTNEDPFDNTIVQQAVPHPDSNLTTETTSKTAFTTTLMRAVRVKINSGDGTVRFTITQQSTA